MAKIVKWSLDGIDNIVDTISLVSEPAIEIQWQAFSKQKYSKEELFEKVYLKCEQDEEFQKQTLQYLAQEDKYNFEVPKERFQDLQGQNLLVAPAMVADKLILRIDEAGDPFYGFFDAQAIRQALYTFQKNGLTGSFNINHDGEDVDGVYLVESWLVQDTTQDTSIHYGFNLPVGSWMAIVKVEDNELYEQYVASGELTGFSIEAMVIEQIII